MSLGLEIDQKIEMIQGLIEKAMIKSGSNRPIYISFDEYSAGGNTLSGSLTACTSSELFYPSCRYS